MKKCFACAKLRVGKTKDDTVWNRNTIRTRMKPELVTTAAWKTIAE